MESTHETVADGHALKPGDLGETLENTRADLLASTLWVHGQLNATSAKLLETTAFLHAAIDLLAERGLISIEELDARKQDAMERLARLFLKQGMGVILLEPEADKYTFPDSAEVDCASRIHLCHAACCRLSWALSSQDVEEGIVRWELGDPYINRREADGYCCHLDRATLACTIREHRSIPCRAYTCKTDTRIWRDFEGMMPQPNLEENFRDELPGRAFAKARPGH